MKKLIRSWMLFDWAAQPFHTVIVTFIFAPYFASVVVGDEVEGQSLIAIAATIAALFIAALAPISTALAEYGGGRKKWIAVLSMLFVVFCFGIYFELSIFWLMFCYTVSYFLIEMLLVFTNAYLPEITSADEIGAVSSKAWGLGYLGGLIVLFVFLLFLMPAPGTDQTVIKLSPIFPENFGAASGPISAIWYLVFMIPFFLFMPDTKRKVDIREAMSRSSASMVSSFILAWKDRQLFWFFATSLISRDALAGIFIFGSLYAKGVLGWSLFFIAIYGIVLNITGVLGGLLAAFIDKRRGSAIIVKLSLWMYTIVSFVALSTNQNEVIFIPVSQGSVIPHVTFFICGMLIGAGAASLQGSLRGMVGPLTHGKISTSEAYGLYGMLGRATAFLAPLLISIFTEISQSVQYGAWPIVGLFVISLLVFYRFERIGA